MARDPQSGLTDEMLRKEVAQGVSNTAIAAKYGVTPTAIGKRVKRLELATLTQTAMQPMEANRFVAQQVNLAETLARGLARMEWMLEADEEWLTDPQTGKANLNPRGYEIDVIYFEPDPHSETGAMVKRRETLQTLLDRALDNGGRVYDGWESKIADARTNITNHQAEVRKTVDSMVSLYDKIVLHRTVQTLIDRLREIIYKLEETDPTIALQLRRDLLAVWPGGLDSGKK